MLETQTNVPLEWTLTAAHSHTDIFNDIEVDVIVTGPHDDGAMLPQEWRVPAFWGGENVFRVRFAAPQAGRYSWTSECSDTSDVGLHRQSGELQIAPYEGSNPLYLHGRLQAAKSQRHFEHEDGTPFFWLADTWWMGLTSRLGWPDDMRLLTQDRVDKGFSVIQIVAGPLPDYQAETETWAPAQANEGGWPWQEDWARINPAWYDIADRKLLFLLERGLVPCIVAMWGFYLPFIGVERAQKHWRNLIARYGAYPVFWCLAGELDMPSYRQMAEHSDAWERVGELQKTGWSEVAIYLREVDPFRNPLTAHPPCYHDIMDSRAIVTDEGVLDFVMLQTGHDDRGSFRRALETLLSCWKHEPALPVLNAEPAYEGIMGGSWQDVQRYLFWSSLTSGAAGHTYGAQGIWAMHSHEQPSGASAESWGGATWREAMELAGSTQLGLGRKFFDGFEWHRFVPRDEPDARRLGRLSSLACGIPGKVAVFYLPGLLSLMVTDAALHGMNGACISVEAGIEYSAWFFDPRTGARREAGKVRPNSEGLWPVPQAPSREDWVLVLEAESG